MKIRKLFYALLILPLFATQAQNVFAANIYGIEYAGGEPLGASNMQIEPTLIDELSALIRKDNITMVTYSDSDLWEGGYWKSTNTCEPITYFRVVKDNDISPSDNLYVEIESEQYVTRVDFESVILEDSLNQLGDDEVFTVGVREDAGMLDAGYEVYSDEECQDIIEGTKRQVRRQDSRLFVETNIKLAKKNDSDDDISDQLYFGITDIDAAQSYKILNPENLLTAESMIARSATALQPTNSDLRNMFVASGNYIYSEFTPESDLLIVGGNDVFVKVNVDIQEDGLSVIFGFAEAATSGTEFYAKQFPVHYDSDENGEVIGITDEEVISGDNPTGSETEPNEGYEFEYWVADKDVELEDDTEIEKGKPLTPAQVKQVIVTEELTFTAIHGTAVAVPNTGASTSEFNAIERIVLPVGMAIVINVVGLLISAVRRERSRVRF